MPDEIVIAIDAMGGDNAPSEIIKGAIAALSDERLKIILFGQEELVNKELSKHSFPAERVEAANAPQVIETGESPTQAISQKKGSSIVLGLNAVKDKKASSFVSAGATGALLAGATVIAGRIPGIQRPALGTLLPNEAGYSFLIDSGANVDAKPGYLLQFAIMGSIYMESVCGVRNPRVGLLNIGAEREKGNALTKEAYPLLEAAGLNFIGNIEARDVPQGAADVVVCDAFAGNVVLKYTEGFAKSLFSIIKKELMASPASAAGAFLSRGAFKRMKKLFDYSEVGGAPFLGLRGLVVKAHGSSNARAIEVAVRNCVKFAENDITAKIEERLKGDKR
jgi:glycerol-3-phosphate acyltransferase PlsX